MRVLMLCGSARPDSSNRKLLEALPGLSGSIEFVFFDIHQLPLFTDRPESSTPEAVYSFRGVLRDTQGLIIATPEYAHNMPAALKNALEWIVASGELHNKKVLPITLTPHAPRGEKCMQSLCWTLLAMDAIIVAQLPLYKTDLIYQPDGTIGDCPAKEMLVGALELFR